MKLNPTKAQLDWHRETIQLFESSPIQRGIEHLWMIGDGSIPLHIYKVNTKDKTVVLINKDQSNSAYHEFTTDCINAIGYKMVA